MLSESSRLVYGDELITATELNQQPGRVLDLAMEHPVTITRNDQHFILLRREEMVLFKNLSPERRARVEKKMAKLKQEIALNKLQQ